MHVEVASVVAGNAGLSCSVFVPCSCGVRSSSIKSDGKPCSTDGTQHERNYPVAPAPMPGSPIQLLTKLCFA